MKNKLTLFVSCVVQIVRVFKRPDGLKDTEIDANGDGTGLPFVYFLFNTLISTVNDITCNMLLSLMMQVMFWCFWIYDQMIRCMKQVLLVR